MENLGSGRNIFNDVTPKHWAYNDITVAFDMGIINGVDNTAFLPDEPIKCNQAVKMIVCALGYSVHAESLGGYPGGYLSEASTLGILEGASNESETIKRKTIAIMAANSLDVNLLKRLSFGSSYTFDVDNDENGRPITFLPKNDDKNKKNNIIGFRTSIGAEVDVPGPYNNLPSENAPIRIKQGKVTSSSKISGDSSKRYTLFAQIVNETLGFGIETNLHLVTLRSYIIDDELRSNIGIGSFEMETSLNLSAMTLSVIGSSTIYSASDQNITTDIAHYGGFEIDLLTTAAAFAMALAPAGSTDPSY
jgi:hypothetical protein